MTSQAQMDKVCQQLVAEPGIVEMVYDPSMILEAMLAPPPRPFCHLEGQGEPRRADYVGFVFRGELFRGLRVHAHHYRKLDGRTQVCELFHNLSQAGGTLFRCSKMRP